MADDGAERADGRIVKMEVDYSSTVDQRLPECEQMAQVRRRAPPKGLSHGAARPRPHRPLVHIGQRQSYDLDADTAPGSGPGCSRERGCFQGGPFLWKGFSPWEAGNQLKWQKEAAACAGGAVWAKKPSS